MNKKICAIILTTIMSLGFAGCGKTQPKEPTKTTKVEQKEKETTAPTKKEITETKEQKAERIAREWANLAFNIDAKTFTEEEFTQENKYLSDEILENQKISGLGTFEAVKKEIEDKKITEKLDKIENMETKKIDNVIDVNFILHVTKNNKKEKIKMNVQVDPNGKITYYKGDVIHE